MTKRGFKSKVYNSNAKKMATQIIVDNIIFNVEITEKIKICCHGSKRIIRTSETYVIQKTNDEDSVEDSARSIDNQEEEEKSPQFEEAWKPTFGSQTSQITKIQYSDLE